MNQEIQENEPELRGNVLLITAEREIRELLDAPELEVCWLADAEAADKQMKEKLFDVAVLDIDAAPGGYGLGLCRHLTSVWPNTPFVIMTGQGDLETAIGAMRAGAYDFVAKPPDKEAALRSLGRALRHRKLRDRLHRLNQQVESIQGPDEMIGSSPSMRLVYDLVHRIAPTDTTVLISGESGTGKELIAKAIHTRSNRREKELVAINCAAVPPSLLESELFGHVSGAFTDAKETRQGLFVRAEGGSLFLDEIGDMPMDMQAKLLRVLQERKLRPVGGDTEIGFDVRLIAATNRDLRDEVKKGNFREDLYYRLNVVQIAVPPLRARGNDVLELAEFFARRAAERCGKVPPTIDVDCARKLLDYHWPGNVRELENAMERAVTLAKSDHITPKGLPERIQKHTSTRLRVDAADPEVMPTLKEVEKSYIKQVLEAVEGSRTQAAKVLDLDRRTLYRRLKKYEEVETA